MTRRTQGAVAGAAYLSYILFAMSSAILSAGSTAGADASQKLMTLSRHMGVARVTVGLDLLQIVCALVLAVTLYQLVKPVDPTIALLAMMFRVGEGLLGFLPLLDKLELMQYAASSGSVGTGDIALLNSILHRPNNGFSEFCFVVGGFLFACLFLRRKLVPRWLAWVGVVTIGVQLICVPLSIATILPRPLVNGLWLPILLYEVPLGIWLLAKEVGKASFADEAGV